MKMSSLKFDINYQNLANFNSIFLNNFRQDNCQHSAINLWTRKHKERDRSITVWRRVEEYQRQTHYPRRHKPTALRRPRNG